MASSPIQFSSVTQPCLTLCNPMNYSTPGLPVHHQLPEFTQTHVHRVGDATQPSHSLSSPSPPAPQPLPLLYGKYRVKCWKQWQISSRVLTSLRIVTVAMNSEESCFLAGKSESESRSVFWLFVTPWNVACQSPPSIGFPGKTSGVGCSFLLQGIFLTQGLNPDLPLCRQTLHCLSHHGKPRQRAENQRHYSADKVPYSHMVFPVVTYSCESWTEKKTDCQRINAFEIWC